MSRSNTGRKPRNVAFDVAVFIRQVLSDLERDLGDAYYPLVEALSSPSRFRSTIRKMLSDAACMDSTQLYAALRQVEACVSKLPAWGSSTAQARQSAAKEKFLAAERRCARANRRIRHYADRPGRLRPLVRQVLDGAKLELFRALGDVPSDEKLFEGCGFGPGTTFGFDRDFSVHRKISGVQTVTAQALPLAKAVLRGQFPNWLSFLVSDPENQRVEIVEGNRIAFVPKTAVIDRTIGIEPSLNVFLQKGVDEYLKVRAYLLGVRILNQDYSIDCLRRFGSDVATIDLSSASDCIAIEAIRTLFPRDWYYLLDSLRSHYYTLDKGATWLKYNKFSSMGNATTFPVESMLFAALARSATKVAGYRDLTKEQVRVYGDDIIVPWPVAGLLIEVLAFLGFSTNPDKTFVFGPFKETCGVDLLRGVDVRPVYLRAIPTRPWHVAGIYNRLLSNRFGFQFQATLTYLWSLVDRPLTGPAHLGYSRIDSGSLEEGGWCNWYAGKNTEGDAYFWAPHAHTLPVKIWHGDHCHALIPMKRWQVVRKKPSREYEEQCNYLAFLLGVVGGEPVGEAVVKTVDTIFHGSYPASELAFPAVYADPTEPSARTIRQVAQWVFGVTG